MMSGNVRASHLLVLAVAGFWATVASDAAAQGSTASDRAVLEALYDATGGPDWTDNTNWKTAVPLGEWFGVTTNTAGRVTSLFLYWNGLTGPIPAELGSLTELEQLELGDNYLTGPIPAELGNLANLESLSLGGYSALTGPVPSWLGRLTGLQSLNLSWNDLTGPIPAELGNLASLESLSLGSNALTGPVPSWLGRLTSLQSLDIFSNDLSGPIPAELGNLTNLEWLYLSYNPLTGSLPQDLTRLSQLRGLNISYTGACAPVDAEFQAWLETIADFHGDTCNRSPESVDTIPPQALAESGTAVSVSMHGYFTDPDDDPLTYAAASGQTGTVTALASGDTVWLVPGAAGSATVTVTATDPGGLSATQAIAVTVNASAGPRNDREVLEVLYDSTGGASWTDSTNWKTAAPLTDWYGVSTDEEGRVVGLSLSGNGLRGPLPDALGNLSSLESLWLYNNGLTGPIPSSLGRLSNLWALDLGLNDLTGQLPDGLGDLPNLVQLDLVANRLTGPIPSSLDRLSNLRTLDLGWNDLTGRIPEGLGSLANLRSLRLGGNELTGRIPDGLGNLANLESLDLGGNGLTGPIPATLGRLSNLTRLDFWYSWGLSGSLPGGLESSSLEELGIFATQACAPTAWRDWLDTIEFEGRLCEVEPEVTIDVAVVYTPAAREAAGGTAEIEAVIDLMVAETNQAYQASGVHHRLALVARSEVQYAEAGAGHDLDRLADPSDGYMDEVHAMRDRTGADLVHLVLKSQDFPGGIALLGGAFGVTCQHCGGVVFAHELGHNMGLRHDRYQVHHHEGGVRQDPAYGYVNQPALTEGAARSRRWVTIMSYDSECLDTYTVCSDLLRFSNPRQSYNGDPLGVPFGSGRSGVSGPADAAGVLNATGPAVALWRDPPARANRPPAAAGTLPDRALTLPGNLTLDVSSAFVDPDGDALSYSVSSSAPDVVSVMAAGVRLTLTAVSEGTATIRVTATDPGRLIAVQAFRVTVGATVRVPFTDDPIVPGVTPVRAIHFTELRTRINSLRVTAGLARFTWTDPVLSAGVTRVKLVHLLELRSALAAAYAALRRPVPSWTDATLPAAATPIRAAHLMELRAAVMALEGQG